MGLDMYLEKMPREKDYKNLPHYSGEEIGYWRKANHIHKWFVDNVQGGVDDCELYEVTREKLIELLKACTEVISASRLIEGKVINGHRYENGELVPILKDGKKIQDTSVAMRILPTQRGFFFGGTSYDEYYLDEVMRTVQIVIEAIINTDFENEMVCYIASW